MIKKLKRLLTMGITLASLTSLHGQSVPTNGLVAYYAFDGNLNATFISAPITLSSAAQYGINRFGVAGKALYLNGSTYGTIANQAATYFSGDFTTTFWSITSPSPPRNGRVLSVSSPSGYEMGQCTDYGTNQYEPLLVFSSLDKSFDLAALASLPTNQWVMFMLRYKSGIASFWTNGSKLFEFSAGQPSGGTMNIGQKSAPGYDKFMGSVDDLRFYNRALSDAEMLSLYQAERVDVICSPRRATATAQVVNGFLVGATITDSGCGYTNNPLPTVTITGGGGSGGIAQAVVSNGQVTGINIINAGSGYTSTPTITISAPPRVPKLYVNTLRVRVTMDVTPGLRYQLESSSNLTTWTNIGTVFTAASEQLIQDYDVDTTGRYFRIQEVP